MQKAISTVIATIMLLLISVSLISVFYVFSSTIAGTTTSSSGQQASQLTKQFTTCMRIDSISGNTVDLRNCGKGVIENKSLVVTMGDVKLGASTLTINEGDSGTVNITGLWNIPFGKHNLKISNGATFAQALVDVQPNKDGLVGSWSFDEGSGTFAGDGSGNGNTGTLLPSGSEPQWVNGKFNKGLRFDGTNDYIDAGTFDLTNKAVSLWVNDGSGWYWLLDNNGMTYKNGIVQSISIPLLLNRVPCYQETANVSTSCGGLNSGSYYVNISSNTGYFYINYSKPVNALNTSLWQVSRKNTSYVIVTENFSIPNNCWNQNPLQFENTLGYLIGNYLYCFNGSSWQQIGNSYIPASAWSANNNSIPYLYDGNWATGTSWVGYGQNTWATNDSYAPNTYEEAMWWNISSSIGDYSIGQYSNGTYFNGVIDEVRIWKKAVALDDTIIMKQTN